MDVPGVDPLKYQQQANLSAAAASDEAMTVKLRYKEPDDATSSLLSVVVGNHASTSAVARPTRHAPQALDARGW